MRTDFYFIRHGQTDNNALNVWQGKDSNAALNEKGILQVKNLAEKLDKLRIERLYTSNLRRAEQTARLISIRCDIPVYVNTELREVDYGVAEGSSVEDVFKMYPSIAQLWYNPNPQRFDNHFEEGESHIDILNRVFPLLDNIIRFQRQYLQMPEWRIGIVSHAGVISTIMAALGVKNPKIGNCEVVHIVHDDDYYHFNGKLF